MLHICERLKAQYLNRPIGTLSFQLGTIKVRIVIIFFPCLVPSNNSFLSSLYTDEDTRSDLQMQIQAMCPAGKSSNVWLDFCVQSYEVDINGEKDRRFRIFDTELKMH